MKRSAIGGSRRAGAAPKEGAEAPSEGRTLSLQGFQLRFPFEPYAAQKAYMSKVLAALKAGENALLESPTGTGKTLCLLVSCLAFQQAMRGQQDESGSVGIGGEAGLGRDGVIIYASRTHSQLSQVVSELKRTDYKPTIAIMASREQLCVNREVQKLRGSRQNAKCGRLVRDNECSYKRALHVPSAAQSIRHEILDIEDLTTQGRERHVCPYYVSREAAETADLVLVPYSYLLQPSFRSTLRLNWSQSVVVFDEAHNLESFASEAASFKVDSVDIAGVIREIDELRARADEPGYDVAASGLLGGDLPKGSLDALKVVVLNIEDALMDVPLLDPKGITMEGKWIFLFLNHCRITDENHRDITMALEKAAEMYWVYREERSAAFGGLASPPGSSAQSSRPAQGHALLKLEVLAAALRSIFRGENKAAAEKAAEMYRVHICEAEEGAGDAKGGGGKAPRELAYWCFSPSVAMQELPRLGVRSCVVTSGTLAPLKSFGAELGLPFSHALENAHVVPKASVWAGVLGSGPSGQRLSSDFQTRSTPAYLAQLGATLHGLCASAPGGVLVFFPSFKALETARASWTARGEWSRLRARKELFVEPRGAAAMQEVIELYGRAAASPRGALLLAVCRGKASEGVDFRDHRARLVVVTGIPFAPARDARVVAKRDFLDQRKQRGGVSGTDWYLQAAARAVNQALGRAIRHIGDHGAMLLLDQRFQRPQQRALVTGWIRRSLTVFDAFDDAKDSLEAFFRDREDRAAPPTAPRPPPEAKAGAGGEGILGPDGQRLVDGGARVRASRAAVESGYLADAAPAPAPAPAPEAPKASGDCDAWRRKRRMRMRGAGEAPDEAATAAPSLRLLSRRRAPAAAAPRSRPAAPPRAKARLLLRGAEAEGAGEAEAEAAAGAEVAAAGAGPAGERRRAPAFGARRGRRLGAGDWGAAASEAEGKRRKLADLMNLAAAPGGKARQRGAGGGSVACGICYGEGEALAAACGHVFCRSCWRSWAVRKAECPTCRKPVAAGELKPVLLES